MSKISGQSTRAIGASAFDGGGLREQAGIVSGRLVEWAETFECDPERILRIVEYSSGIDPVMDTAREKPRESHERPTSHDLRSIALTREDVGILAAHLSMDSNQI